MKIICVGRNYAEHAAELKNEVPQEPVIFLKPDTSLLIGKQPFFIPSFTDEIHYELELVIRIHRVGKNIEERFAHRYYDAVSVGIDFTARDLQAKCKKGGLPWEISKAFDGSAAVGSFVPIPEGKTVQQLGISLTRNGMVVQDGHTHDMVFNVSTLISYISKFFTLKIGDLIFTGTPAGVGKVESGDKLEAFLEGQALLSVAIK